MVHLQLFHSKDFVSLSLSLSLAMMSRCWLSASAEHFGGTWLTGRVAALRREGNGGFPPSPAILPVHKAHKFWQDLGFRI